MVDYTRRLRPKGVTFSDLKKSNPVPSGRDPSGLHQGSGPLGLKSRHKGV